MEATGERLKRLRQAAERVQRRVDKVEQTAAAIVGAALPDGLHEAEDFLEKAKAVHVSLEELFSKLSQAVDNYEHAISELSMSDTLQEDAALDVLDDGVHRVRCTLNALRVRIQRLETISKASIASPLPSSGTSKASIASPLPSSQFPPYNTPLQAAVHAPRPLFQTAPVHPTLQSDGGDSQRSGILDDASGEAAQSGRNQDQPDNVLNRDEVPLSPAPSEMSVEHIARRVAELLGAGPVHVAQNATGKPVGVKLPKLELPKFSGLYHDWKPFWDRFEMAVHANSQLAGADKLSYLIGCLSGDALKLVKNLSATNENYPAAVDTLRKAFGDASIATESVRSKLYDLHPVYGTDIRRLKSFYFEMESQLGSLDALGADTGSKDLLGILMKKLPFDVVSSMERSKGADKEWSMPEFRRLLGNEINIRESAMRHSVVNDTRDKDDRWKGSNRNQRRLVSTMETYSSNDRGSHQSSKQRWSNSSDHGSHQRRQAVPVTPCVYCQGEHYCDACPKYPRISDRRAVLQKTNRCFLCLSRDHGVKDCRRDAACYYCRRRKAHHTSICPEKDQARNRGQIREQNKFGDEGASLRGGIRDLTLSSEQGTLATDEKTVMKTALVTVFCPTDSAKKAKVRAFFDSGTSRSYVTVRLAKTLGLTPTDTCSLEVERFGLEDEPMVVPIQTAIINLFTANGEICKLSVAISDHAIRRMTRRGVPTDILSPLPQHVVLADVPVKQNVRVPVDFMIGNDYYDDFVTGNKVQLQNGFYLIESDFGWMLSGRLPEDHEVRAHEEGHCFPELGCNGIAGGKRELRKLETGVAVNLEDIWNLEAIGIRDPPNPVTDDMALETFNKTVMFEDGRYMVQWPWKSNGDQLPDNYNVAIRRLKALLKRKAAEGRREFLERYNEIIQGQRNSGVVEEVKDLETVYKVHYLPHHGVETPQKQTTKLRVVYDASSRAAPHLPTLNECMHRGQVFLEDLVGLLVRFRLNTVGFVADLEKAFLQVGLQEAHRDVTRFLWVKDIDKPPEGDNLIVYRFARVSFGIISSPFLLGATLMYHLKQQGTAIADQIAKNIYVDNLVTGVDTPEEAFELYEESKSIFRMAGMNLREYASNSASFMEQIPEVDRAKGESLKVLGMTWELDKDLLVLRGPKPSVSIATKRSVLSNLFQVYDPLGFAVPITIKGKILLQRITKKRHAWNEPLTDEARKEWEKISNDLAELASIEIPRHYGFAKNQPLRLMVFCDASGSAYATVAYLQAEIGKAEYLSQLCFAKSRVNPLKSMSIPRLELMAVTIGVKAVRFLRCCLKFSGRVVLWSDSKSVLHWIATTGYNVNGVFVENRLREIRKELGIEYRFVPSLENPADRASRGASLSALDPVWFHGPEWAMKDENEWPPLPSLEGRNSTAVEKTTTDGDVVMAPEHGLCIQAIGPGESELSMNLVVDPCKCSSYRKLIRVFAWVRRFISCINKKPASRNDLTPEEVRQATIGYVKQVQAFQLQDLLVAIRAKKPHSIRRNLGVELDKDGIMRCYGRLAKIVGNENTKYPMLLPSKSHFTELVIAEFHAKSFHAGVNQTLATLRREFWIPAGRRRVQSVLSRCVICRRHEGGPFERPLMPELPVSRVVRHSPFSFVGVDYFGPVFVRHSGDLEKRWVCLLTCMTTRAVHLEVVVDMSAEEFVLAMQRFMARRGKPIEILSDNASQFKAVRAEDVFSSFLSGSCIRWSFIPQFAPWFGGVYERLVKCVKSAMKKSIGKRLLTHQKLVTVVTEVEFTINSRPLTYVGGDVDDAGPLTPNDLLGVRLHTVVPPDDKGPVHFSSARHKLVEAFNDVQSTAEMFWKRWSDEYLLSLRESTVWSHKDPYNRVRAVPDVKEVVIVKDPSRKRNQWKLAVVHELIPSEDGKIRAVKIRFSNGSQTIRPVSLLYPLECHDRGLKGDKESEKKVQAKDSSESQQSKDDKAIHPVKANGDKRPRNERQSKKDAIDKIKRIADYEKLA